MKFEIPPRYIDEHLVTRKKHPVHDLWIYNYTPDVQFSRLWDEVTLACRGLILDSENNIIARPPAKFFNYGEPDAIIPKHPFTITEKVDGSLLILTRYKGELIFATRGSFESDQCLEAQKIWKEKRYYRSNWLFKEGYTYLFEIIYPENRIVVDYGNARKVIAISWCHNDVGRFHDFPKGYGFPVVKQVHFKYIDNLLFKLHDKTWYNKEGYVIRFENGTHIKAKYDEYIRLHKIVTNLSELSVWELLCNDANSDIENIPDEFHDWFKATKEQLTLKFSDIKVEALQNYNDIINLNLQTRKEIAEEVLKRNNPSLIFSLIDEKNIDKAIWKMLRPINTNN
ncbi:MAG TPA: RNA ligase [Bacteroidales bacterium]|nr:RNA ligase [Bacteroidales bacterium]